MSNDNKNEDERSGFKRELGFPSAIAMVVGSMIASGIFMAPQNLAASTNPKTAIIAWAITGTGSIFIAITFANMVAKIPRTGGPVVYTRVAFGEFPSFLVGWAYWIGAWTSLGALINGCIRYLGNIIPVISGNGAVAFAAASIILWAIIYFNIRGIKQAGSVVVFTTICKLIPLAVFLIIGLFHFHPEYFNTVSSQKVSGINTLSAAIGVTLWSFMGLEMGVFPAEETKNAPVFIKKATIFGTIFVAIIYILVSAVSFGIMPQNQLADSKAPIAEMLNLMTGGRWGGIFISIGVVISTLGAATGCAIVTARCSYACAANKTFPAVFKKMNLKYGTPEMSLIIVGILTNLLLILNYVKGLNAAYQFIMLLSTMSTLPAYITTAGAEMLTCKKYSKNLNIGNFIGKSIVPLVAFAYSCYAVYGCGQEAVLWGFILMLLGIPFYLYVKIDERNKTGIDCVDRDFLNK
ncbi:MULTISPECIES: amino acid permease [Clostridium]|uniref:Amino acid permease n=1 Tax=Clostridium lapidicellarium TaxID=3240931 RepID=A0ABV4DZG1_9CLOT